MSRTAIFRADAGPEIGSGHVIRSLTLAEEWMERGGKAVICGTIPPGLHQRITETGAEFASFPQISSLADDASKTVAVALDQDAGWVVVDGYSFDADYVTALKTAGLKVLQFADGMVSEPFSADIILDQNLGSESRSYELTTPGAKTLQGIKFACIGKQFRSLIGEKGIASRAKSVLVTFGGSDQGNMTGLVVEALQGIGELESVVVVIGVANSYSAEIGAMCRADPRFECVNNVNNMARLMAEADIAVAAAGSTSWELAALGVPSILITTADNQEPIAKAISEHGAAISMGYVDITDVASVRTTTRTLAGDRQRRIEMSKAGQALVDGEGATRVVDAMLAYQETPPSRGQRL